MFVGAGVNYVTMSLFICQRTNQIGFSYIPLLCLSWQCTSECSMGMNSVSPISA